MNKKKAHKTRRQIQAEKLAFASSVVQKANALENPLEPFKKFHHYVTKENEIISLQVKRVSELPQETLNWIFDLMERNMKTYYEQSQWKWDAAAKQTELTEPSAWYLIAFNENNMLGFSHFRFDLDNQAEVLYCYELQLEPSARRKGLGRFMMQCLEVMASNNQMQKLVLTVLKKNVSACSFFFKLGFKTDITNPSASEGLDYAILSKQNLQRT
ncbi:N-alpha-acetyltransferase 40 [Trichogramma pretiosum]|uniref:N-alpha-acetyltransferase 40 n=1 Tax=Trichogramma pretiosum TaxID=7493 RepID=UPI0006C953F6|nr:N-alpha-acetyltransferase 40 [Trichogramma pretiosum]